MPSRLTFWICNLAEIKEARLPDWIYQLWVRGCFHIDLAGAIHHSSRGEIRVEWGDVIACVGGKTVAFERETFDALFPGLIP